MNQCQIWMEILILYHLANFLCVKTSQNKKKVQRTNSCNITGTREVYKIQRPNSASIQINNKSKLPELLVVRFEGYQTNHDASNSINEESCNEEQEDTYTEQKISPSELNKWKSCSVVIEKMFFLMWLMANLVSIGLLVYLSTGNTHKWHIV